MFSDEPLNLNQARTKGEYDQKIVFLHIHNSGRLIAEMDDKDLADVFDQFVSFMISVGYSELTVWNIISDRVSTRGALEALQSQFRTVRTEAEVD